MKQNMSQYSLQRKDYLKAYVSNMRTIQKVTNKIAPNPNSAALN